jgi:hypothetical protein
MTPVVIDGPKPEASTTVDELVSEAENDAGISESELDEIKQLAVD